MIEDELRLSGNKVTVIREIEQLILQIGSFKQK